MNFDSLVTHLRDHGLPMCPEYPDVFKRFMEGTNMTLAERRTYRREFNIDVPPTTIDPELLLDYEEQQQTDLDQLKIACIKAFDNGFIHVITRPNFWEIQFPVESAPMLPSKAVDEEGNDWWPSLLRHIMKKRGFPTTFPFTAGFGLDRSAQQGFAVVKFFYFQIPGRYLSS